MEFFNPNDFWKREQERWNESNKKFEEHMKEHWKSLKEKEDNKFKTNIGTNIVIGVLGLILMTITVLLTCKQQQPIKQQPKDTLYIQLKTTNSASLKK